MNEKDNKKLEHLVDKIMKETSLESPSLDFTSKIISQVEVMVTSKVTRYKPLISKPVWIGLFALLLGAVSYSFFYSTPESNWLSNLDFSILDNFGISNSLSNLVLSETMLYAIVLFATMFAVQISLLKVYFKRRLSV